MDIFTWKIHTLERLSNDGTVTKVFWELEGKRSTEENNFYLANVSGSAGLFPPDPNQFIPYTELTSDIVLDWLKKTIGDAEIQRLENNIKVKLELLENPVKKIGVPWKPEKPNDGNNYVWNEELNIWQLQPEEIVVTPVTDPTEGNPLRPSEWFIEDAINKFEKFLGFTIKEFKDYLNTVL